MSHRDDQLRRYPSQDRSYPPRNWGPGPNEYQRRDDYHDRYNQRGDRKPRPRIERADYRVGGRMRDDRRPPGRFGDGYPERDDGFYPPRQDRYEDERSPSMARYESARPQSYQDEKVEVDVRRETDTKGQEALALEEATFIVDEQRKMNPTIVLFDPPYRVPTAPWD